MCRASWPEACAALAYSGVPKAGAPERMSTLEVKPPYITGTPGRTIWVSTMPSIASACCCTSAPASVTGLMAPASVKGVITFTWPCSAMVMRPSPIGMSSCSGELVLMMPSSAGVWVQLVHRQSQRQRAEDQPVHGARAAQRLGLPALVQNA